MKKFSVPLLLPLFTISVILIIWQCISYFEVFPDYAFPTLNLVLLSFAEELSSLRLVNDTIASLWRVIIGFLLSATVAIPLGLYFGHRKALRQAFIPTLNFFRFLSPLAWIPFAILWFHIGDKPAVFLIFLATFFPLCLSVISSVATIPDIYFRVAKEYHYKGSELLLKITLPAILPQLISALRICYGISWIVIVAAEMVGCQDGLGYGIWDARNALRLDTAVCYMITIGILGMTIDRVFLQFTKAKNIKWGYGK
ncbi:ABC transporter permease subunit [Pedobacter petrophilus]|uniref:ABC transporter permease subunit n=1 Tax=Pedobacter petrophilus TaxID=1908241 RepID=A0A7K0G2U2_9SPHI|nr:ABC transporter permease [Pedobacter petrophilus]MRX78135.1 ABC transporter permease subunit [Pedobacter petrophilus]